MPSYGRRFHKPRLSHEVYPGSWTYLKGSSPFTTDAITYVINYLRHTLKIIIDDNPQVTIFTVGTQIVSGINIYVEFRIHSNPSLDVQALIHEPSLIAPSSNVKRNPIIEHIYATNNKIF